MKPATKERRLRVFSSALIPLGHYVDPKKSFPAQKHVTCSVRVLGHRMMNDIPSVWSAEPDPVFIWTTPFYSKLSAVNVEELNAQGASPGGCNIPYHVHHTSVLCPGERNGVRRRWQLGNGWSGRLCIGAWRAGMSISTAAGLLSLVLFPTFRTGGRMCGQETGHSDEGESSRMRYAGKQTRSFVLVLPEIPGHRFEASLEPETTTRGTISAMSALRFARRFWKTTASNLRPIPGCHSRAIRIRSWLTGSLRRCWARWSNGSDVNLWAVTPRRSLPNCVGWPGR